MTQLLDLRAIVREQLADTTMWPNTTLDAWIKQAIRDYSNYFPLFSSESIPTAADVKTYTLGATYCPGIISVVRVEYPTGNEPPTYLSRLDQGSLVFYDGDFYDLKGEPPNSITISKSPTNSQYIGVQFTKLHTIPTGDTSTITVPDKHLELISLFCIWKAAEEIFMNEEIDPDTREFLVSQMGLNAIRAERIYRNKIQDFQQASQSRRGGPWLMDDQDRIY